MSIFEEERYAELARALAPEYASGVPFPHIAIDDFLAFAPSENETDDVTATGALGSAVVLTPEEERRSRAVSSRHQLNLVASDKVPLDRSLMDHRDPK